MGFFLDDGDEGSFWRVVGHLLEKNELRSLIAGDPQLRRVFEHELFLVLVEAFDFIEKSVAVREEAFDPRSDESSPAKLAQFAQRRLKVFGQRRDVVGGRQLQLLLMSLPG